MRWHCLSILRSSLSILSSRSVTIRANSRLPSRKARTANSTCSSTSDPIRMRRVRSLSRSSSNVLFISYQRLVRSSDDSCIMYTTEVVRHPRSASSKSAGNIIFGLFLGWTREDRSRAIELDELSHEEEAGEIADACGLLHVMRYEYDRV